MRRKKAIEVLEKLKAEISVEEPRVKGGYAKRFRESIKVILGKDSDFYDSAKEINFLRAHPDFNNNLLSQNDPKSSCGIARDLLDACIKHIEDFGIYSPLKANFLGHFNNWKLIGLLVLIAFLSLLLGAIIADSFHGSESIFTRILFKLKPLA